MNRVEGVTHPQGPLFFFALMSPYSWLAAERIDELMPHAGWTPVFAGGLFKARERTSWGLTDRREAEVATCEARARARGLGEIVWPQPWPTFDHRVARACLFAGEQGLLRPFALAAMRLAFTEGADLSLDPSLEEAATRSGVDPSDAVMSAGSPRFKDALRDTTDRALALGVQGVPTTVVGNRLFWGDDRLEAAAADAASRGRA